MRHIKFDPNQLTGEQKQWWDAWLKKADKSLQKTTSSWEKGDKKLSFDDKVWKELRDWMKDDVFKGKCAYCETKIVRYTLDAEHYRPKAGVQVRRNGKLERIDHQGYFWLAYHWKNLLPSCEFCNRSGGKGNQFPVRNTHVSLKDAKDLATLQPEDLDLQEEPLLLNPYTDNPHDHIRFGFGTAYAVNNSDRGEQSIEIYRLNQDELLSERMRAQDDAWQNYLVELLAAKGKDIRKTSQKVLKRYEGGEDEYSTAILDYIRLQLEQL